MTYDKFVKKYIGTKIDYDGVSGVQCVDLVKLYLDEVFGIKPGAWGNAKDYWLSFSSHPELTDNFTKIKNTPDFVPKKGDIVVWSGDIGISTSYGHIAIATGEGDTSTFYTYDENWNGKEMKKVKHNYYAVYGVLRPKNESQIISVPEVKLGTYKLTNVRGIYNGAGASTGRKKVSALTPDGRKNATSKKPDSAAYLKAGTAVTLLETKQPGTGNLWARIPSGWLCIWEAKNDKLFIK